MGGTSSPKRNAKTNGWLTPTEREDMRNKLHTAVAASELGMTTQGILKHIAAGNLRTERLGHVHVIDRADFEEFKRRYYAREFDGRATR